MNLRITDASGLVMALDHLLRAAGEPVHAAGGWTVVEVGDALFCYGPGSEGGGRRTRHSGPASDSPRLPDVGGPYPTLGALLRDAGRRVAASPEMTSEGDPVWEVRAWAGGFYVVRASRLDVASRHESLDSALADAAPACTGLTQPASRLPPARGPEASRHSRSDSDSTSATN